jgi:hypothetical protein
MAAGCTAWQGFQKYRRSSREPSAKCLKAVRLLFGLLSRAYLATASCLWGSLLVAWGPNLGFGVDMQQVDGDAKTKPIHDGNNTLWASEAHGDLLVPRHFHATCARARSAPSLALSRPPSASLSPRLRIRIHAHTQFASIAQRPSSTDRRRWQARSGAPGCTMTGRHILMAKPRVESTPVARLFGSTAGEKRRVKLELGEDELPRHGRLSRMSLNRMRVGEPM